MTEPSHLFTLVSRLCRIKAEKQHVIAVESRIDRLKVAKRSDEQPRTDNHNERQRHLSDHQTAAQASPAPRSRLTVKARLDRPDCAQPGRAKCWSQSKPEPSSKRNQERKPEDGEIRMNIESYPVWPERH